MEVVFIILIFVIIIIYQKKFLNNNIVYVRSELDNKYYLVRNLPDKQIAVNLLSKIKQNIFILVNYLYTNNNNDPESKENIKKLACDISYNSSVCKKYKEYISILYHKIQKTEISEGIGSEKYTSYSVNKGEQLVICLRSLKTNELHDINIIMYVVIHELSHIACPEYGHTELFKEIFAYLLRNAIAINLYKRIDFYKYPEDYCGLMLTDSIY